jgi:hypothetical protein
MTKTDTITTEPMLTERQEEFIKVLISGFDVTTVLKSDASEIIECLSKFQNSYAPCGRHRSFDIGRAFVLGDIDWCLHHCDKGGPDDCKMWNCDMTDGN